MSRTNTIILLIVLALFAFALWIIFPLQGERFGRQGIRLGLDLQGGLHIGYRADLSSVAPGEEKATVEGVMAVIENRINPLGVTEPVIQLQGDDRIMLELPGLSITDVEKERLGRVALLEFREQKVDEEGNVTWVPATGTIDGQEKVLNSSYFKENTYVRTSEMGGVLLVFEWNEEGSKLSEQVTGRLIDKPLGIFEGDTPLLGDDDQPIAPIVRSQITTSGQIEGLSLKEAQTLSNQLNAGRLPVPLEIIYEQSITPILGADFVAMSVKAGIIGMIMVMLFMIIYYRIPGVIASLALVYYAVLLLAIFKLFGVTLTLAGIGGFILSVGMAIDANVLIFERMKEELRAKRTLGAAIEAGFSRAWPAIWDSNITTILAALILFWLGSSIVASAPVKGFAITLIIGVVVSMFTAIMVTRTFLRPFVGTRLARWTSLFTPYQGRENA
jgi:preprotein translocase subunit SecD